MDDSHIDQRDRLFNENIRSFPLATRTIYMIGYPVGIIQRGMVVGIVQRTRVCHLDNRPTSPCSMNPFLCPATYILWSSKIAGIFTEKRLRNRHILTVKIVQCVP